MRVSRSKWLGLGGIVLTLPLFLSACSTTPAPTVEPTASPEATDEVNPFFEMLPASFQDSGVIKVGTSPNSPPLIRMENDKAVGVIPDLAAGLEELFGVEFDIQAMDYAGLIPAMQAERIDINWSVINDTVERQEIMVFVDFMRADHGFMVLKGNPLNIDSADALCGTRAGTVKGGLDQAFLEEQEIKCQQDGLAPMELLLYNNRQDIQTALLAGNVDSFLGILPSHVYQVATVQDGNAFELAPGSYLTGIFGIAMNKSDDQQLALALQAGIKELVRNGVYEESLKRHDAFNYALTEEQILINGVGNGL